MRFYSTLRKSIRCQRGIALPMAMLTLLTLSGLMMAFSMMAASEPALGVRPDVAALFDDLGITARDLSALMIGFSLMAASEPVLANNQLQVAQARAVAESGIERAVWALNNQSATNGIPNTAGAAYPMGAATASAPYDGSVAAPVMMNGLQVGVFTVVVTQGAVANERIIVATGWYPTNTGTGPKVKQKIQVSVLQSLFAGNPPPAALTVRGEISAGGNSSVDSQSDMSCGPKPGSFSAGLTDISGSAQISGADGNSIANQSGDAVQFVPDATFDQYTYSSTDLNTLKAFAKKHNTYYQGTVTFNAGNPMPNGVIFVDTVSGLNIDKDGPGTTSTSDFASVDIHGNAPPATPEWSAIQPV